MIQNWTKINITEFSSIAVTKSIHPIRFHDTLNWILNSIEKRQHELHTCSCTDPCHCAGHPLVHCWPIVCDDTPTGTTGCGSQQPPVSAVILTHKGSTRIPLFKNSHRKKYKKIYCTTYMRKMTIENTIQWQDKPSYCVGLFSLISKLILRIINLHEIKVNCVLTKDYQGN